MELINIKDLIQELKNKNIDLGKGDPYNRLRYYTKIGWIDHMVRKKDSQGIVTGHYPSKVLEKIIEIENLKKTGLSNEEITSILKNKKNEPQLNIQEFSKTIKSKFNINIIILLLIIIGFVFELNNNYSLNDKIMITPKKEEETLKEIKIDEKGRNIMPSGKNKIFINSKNINLKSNILVTFEGRIDPATHYFISEKIIEEGFTVETNYPVAKDVNFNWIVIN